MTGWGPGAGTFFCLWWSVAPVVGQALGWSGSWILYGAAQDSKIVCIDNLASEEALLFGRAKRVSRERARGEAASGRGKERLQRSLIKFHLYFAQTKGNTIGWKMTFRKTKLIDYRPSWHPLRLCVKFGSQGDQIGTENLFQPSKQTRGLV